MFFRNVLRVMQLICSHAPKIVLIPSESLLGIGIYSSVRSEILVCSDLDSRPKLYLAHITFQYVAIRLVHNTIAIDVGRGNRGLLNLCTVSQV